MPLNPKKETYRTFFIVGIIIAISLSEENEI